MCISITLFSSVHDGLLGLAALGLTPDLNGRIGLHCKALALQDEILAYGSMAFWAAGPRMENIGEGQAARAQDSTPR